MIQPHNKKYLPLIFGALTLILFATRPYILDLIAPAKSVGQIIGEQARDLLDGLKGEAGTSSNSKREICSNLLTILAFISFTVALITSFRAVSKDDTNWIGIAGGILAIIGLIIYFAHLSIGLIGLFIIAMLVVVVVVFEGGF